MVGRILAVRYELTALIAEGPVFDFYSCRDKLTGRTLGLRLLKDPYNQEDTFVQAILDVIPQLQTAHPSIERIEEFAESEGQHFLIGEMPKGSLLTERIKHFAPFSVAVALATGVAICEGLVGLHDEGIVHGDVGAHNVVATHEGGAKLQLGGLWRSYSSSKKAGVAVLSQMAFYLAPEVSHGERPSPTSDLYGLGVILFQLLTGRYPFDGGNPTATVARHTTGQIPSARGLNPSVPVAVDQFVQKLLAKNPKDRPGNAVDCLSEMRQLNDSLRFGRPATKQPETIKVAGAQPKPEPAEVAPKKTPRGAAPAIGGVAPQMSAIRDVKKEKRQKPERDVPVWLWAVATIFVLTTIAFTGAWVISTFQKPKLVSVPNLRGLSYSEAVEVGKRVKLNVKISAREPSDTVDIDKIIQEKPAANQKVREGGSIYVVLSTGSRFVLLPKLIGMTLDEAKGVLAKLNLEIDGAPIRQPDNVNPPGSIVRQMPEPEKKVERMTPVRVWIAAPPDAPPGSLPGESPDAPSAYTYRIYVRLTDATERVKVRIELTDERETKKVFEEERDPDSVIELNEVGYGKKVTIRVYYNDELRIEKEQYPEKAP